MVEVEATRQPAEERVLVLAPTAKDADASRTLLAEAGMECTICADLATLCRELEAGAGAAVLTEEALLDDEVGALAEVVGRQPPWSDLPLLLLTGGGADSLVALRALATLGNVTLLERPVRVTTLVSAVRAALRARRRQYQIRSHLAEQQRVAQSLREADRRKDEFLAMLAHELRNPLAPVRTALEILRRQCRADPIVERLSGMMERQVGHMVRLVDDLLDISRITRGKIELKIEPVDLVSIVSRSVESVRHFLDERRHCLELTLAPGPLPLDADPARIEQVLTNLLTNAAKYTELGGHIHLTAERDGGEAVVRVRDNGIGIRPEALPRLFEMFQQADRLPGRVSEGLGLGLTLVKNLVEMHGGVTEAHSAGPDQGSEFTIRLPLGQEAARLAQAAAVSEATAPSPPIRVLLVDDNVDGAESLALLLRLAGHEVRVAHDGPSALEAAAAFRPQAAFLDIALPTGMDGYTLARHLRELPGMADAMLVAMTGYGQPEDLARTRAAGMDHHLVKPADPLILQRLLASHAQQRDCRSVDLRP
jgi:signal transduction histidine kinase/CheY-like chemotaxis protein